MNVLFCEEFVEKRAIYHACNTVSREWLMHEIKGILFCIVCFSFRHFMDTNATHGSVYSWGSCGFYEHFTNACIAGKCLFSNVPRLRSQLVPRSQGSGGQTPTPGFGQLLPTPANTPALTHLDWGCLNQFPERMHVEIMTLRLWIQPRVEPVLSMLYTLEVPLLQCI